MNRDAHRAETERIAAQAAHWLQAQRSQPGPETDQGLANWLQASPLHVREFLALSMLEQEMPQMACLQALDADALVAQARAQSNVIPLRLPGRTAKHAPAAQPAGAAPSKAAGWRPRGASHALGWSLAAGCAALVVGALFTWDGAPSVDASSKHFATLVGEHRNVTLDDGSLIALGPRSDVVVRYTAAGRDVQLANGVATFSVAKDPARPFVVHAGNTLVQAVGTQFVVNRLASGTTVAVTEGKVKVTAAPLPPMERVQAALRYITPTAASSGASRGSGGIVSNRSGSKAEVVPVRADTSLAAGEQAVLSVDGTALQREPLDRTLVDGLGKGRLVFRNSTLSDIADQFNRYNVLPMEVRSPRLAAMQFSGVFDANDPTSFLQFLSHDPQIATFRSSDRFLIVPRGERP